MGVEQQNAARGGEVEFGLGQQSATRAGEVGSGKLNAARGEMDQYILEIWSQYLQKCCQDLQHFCFVMFSLIIDKLELPG